METIVSNKLQQFVVGLDPTQLPVPHTLQLMAQNHLLAKDFPTTKSERFKYTRLAKLANAQMSNSLQLEKAQLSQHKILTDAYTVYINNKQIILPTDLPSGLQIKLNTEEQDTFHEASFYDVFGALNILYAQNGISIRVANNCTLDKPIQIVQVNSGGKYFYRHHFNFGENAEAAVYIVTKSTIDLNSFAHTHFQYDIAQSARIKVYKIQDCCAGHFDFHEDRAKQNATSHFEINTLTLDGSFVRNDTMVAVKGEHAQTYLNGAYWLKEEEHVANYTTIDHQVANCESFETYKGVAADKSTAVFNGKVFVRKDAQKTNAYQSNANVLLSDSASVNSKPELEIYADDVKCSHGSTTGQLDDNALFYLRARGLSAATAKTLLLQAFMEDVLTYVKQDEALAYVHQRIAERFDWNY
jgi:Fe-S cluster assembly protein SufD